MTDQKATSTASSSFGPPEEMYCAEQIEVPPDLPKVLKEYTKAAIRTQPDDLLAWSARYFEALIKGEKLPVKERLELPNAERGKLTERMLASLHRQLGDNEFVPEPQIRERWIIVGASVSVLDANLKTGGWADDVNWLDFLAMACGQITRTLKEAMEAFCRVYSDDPPGGAARIHISVFSPVLKWMATQDTRMGNSQLQSILAYLTARADVQGGMVGPRNLQHKDCPSF